MRRQRRQVSYPLQLPSDLYIDNAAQMRQQIAAEKCGRMREPYSKQREANCQ